MKKLNWNALWLSLYALGIGIWLIGMPSYLDDWCYMEPLRGWNDARGIDDPTVGGYSRGEMCLGRKSWRRGGCITTRPTRVWAT